MFNLLINEEEFTIVKNCVVSISLSDIKWSRQYIFIMNTVPSPFWFKKKIILISKLYLLKEKKLQVFSLSLWIIIKHFSKFLFNILLLYSSYGKIIKKKIVPSLTFQLQFRNAIKQFIFFYKHLSVLKHITHLNIKYPELLCKFRHWLILYRTFHFHRKIISILVQSVLSRKRISR